MHIDFAGYESIEMVVDMQMQLDRSKIGQSHEEKFNMLVDDETMSR